MWTLNSTMVYFYLRQASYVLFAAGFFFAGLAVTILLSRRLKTTPMMLWIYNRRYADLKITQILSELLGVTKYAIQIILLIAAFVVGYMVNEMKHDGQEGA